MLTAIIIVGVLCIVLKFVLFPPVMAAMMDRGFQKAKARDQLKKLNEDCLAWLLGL